MKKKMIVGTLLLLGMSQAVTLKVSAADVFAEPQETEDPPQYVVMAEDMEDIENAVGDISAATDETSGSMQDAGIVALDLTSAEVRKLRLADVTVEENIDFTAAASQDQGQAEGMGAEWNLYAAHAEKYVHEMAADEKIKIAVIDSGVDQRPDIPVEGHITEFTGEESAFFSDASGHGTAVASLINAKSDEGGIQGMNEDAQIYSVPVLDIENKGKLSSIVQAVYWAIDHDMDILNMSFGTGYDSEILHRALQDAAESDILLVAAAGNTGGGVLYPAAYGEVIAVGATDREGTMAGDSARGAQVDIYAPGEELFVDTPMGSATVASGTSLACAEVAAAASVVWEQDRTKSAEFVRGLLEETANRAVDEENNNGLLDLEAAWAAYGTYEKAVSATVPIDTEGRPLQTFEDVDLEALWSSTDHKKLIDKYEANQGYRLMCAASAYPDEMDTPMQKNRRFHGSKTYMETLRYLVDLANAYYSKDNSRVAQVKANAPYSMTRTDESYEKKDKDGNKIKVYFGNSVQQCIQEYLENKNVFNLSDVSEGTRHNMAYKIMGVVTHIIGDTYAHRTVMTPDMLSLFDSSHFEKWGTFVADVKAGKVQFRDISKYLLLDSKKLPKKKNQLYEDNPDVLPSRYKNATVAVKRVINDNGSREFRTHSWSDSVMVNRDSLAPS